MAERYEGKVGPADAMGALTEEFGKAYTVATDKIFAAVLEFEKTTGRVVDEIELERLDVTQMNSPGRQLIRQASIHFLPRPDEVVT